MTTRTIKIPGPEHPIAIEQNPNQVTVTVGGAVVAQTTRALTLREASYPPIHYIPREDVDASLIARSKTSTYCPYKGDAAYYGVPAGGERSVDAAWTYEAPFDAVSDISGHLAFYHDRVDSIVEQQVG